MRHLILVWVFQLALLKGDHTLLKNFYKSFHNKDNKILKMEINYSQTQFGNTYNSSGVFYAIQKDDYVYDSFPIKIIVKDDLMTSLNNETMQLVFSSIEKEYLNILGILSGNLNSIEIQDSTSKYFAHFKVLDLNYEGTFQFDKNNGLLKLITLNIDENQNLLIEIISVDFIMDNEIPNINYDNFEIIDLRD